MNAALCIVRVRGVWPIEFDFQFSIELIKSPSLFSHPVEMRAKFRGIHLERLVRPPSIWIWLQVIFFRAVESYTFFCQRGLGEYLRDKLFFKLIFSIQGISHSHGSEPTLRWNTSYIFQKIPLRSPHGKLLKIYQFAEQMISFFSRHALNFFRLKCEIS